MVPKSANTSVEVLPRGYPAVTWENSSPSNSSPLDEPRRLLRAAAWTGDARLAARADALLSRLAKRDHSIELRKLQAFSAQHRHAFATSRLLLDAVINEDPRDADASPASPVIALEGATTHPFRDFLREGVHHILIGCDHIAILLSLLLPVVLRRVEGRWEPVANLRSAVSQATVIVTAFTIAHSVTLSLATLGWVVPSSRWVEAAIAASVLLAALNNIWPVLTKRLWMAAFGFGLVHGFGFAGALSELGLPTGARVLALLRFNLGVEVAQLGLVLVFLPLLYLARSRSWYRVGGMQAMSLVIALLAAWWLQARLFP